MTSMEKYIGDGVDLEEYIGYEVYECPEKPTEYGKYVGKTPLIEQALKACENAETTGKSYFIKGVRADGIKVLFL